MRTAGVSPANCSDTANIGNVMDFNYDFSLGTADNGNVKGITNNRDTTRSQSFTYDTLNRIATAKTTATSGANCWGETFSYDIWANLLSIGGLTGYATCTQEMLNVGVTVKNQISGDTYDAAGNLTATPPPASASYTYDAENRLTSTAGVTYTYDGDGKRVQKSSGKLYWYGTGSDPLDETDLAGNTNNASFYEYIYFVGKRVARRDSSGNMNYYFADHLGTARIVTNAAGTVLDDSDFYPFGGERVVTSSSGNNYKFTGKERDSETGLDNFGARYYGSNMGRFTSPDAPFADQHLEDPQTWNLYSYTRNNPLAFIDYDGREIKYAPGLKNADEVKAIVTAILANPSTSAELSGFVGPNNPDLTITSGDLSAGDTRTVNPDGTVATNTIQGNTEQDIQTTTFNGGTPQTSLNGATITIDNRTSKDDLPGVVVHESKHAGDARRDPAGFAKEVRQESGKPHDQRTQEQRAIQFSKQHAKEIAKQAKEIRKQQKQEEKKKKKKEEQH